MIELENPQIEPVEEAGTTPVRGGSLRPATASPSATPSAAYHVVPRGRAVTASRSGHTGGLAIPGVKEDVTRSLNVKKLRSRVRRSPRAVRLIKSGAGAVTATTSPRPPNVENVTGLV